MKRSACSITVDGLLCLARCGRCFFTRAGRTHRRPLLTARLLQLANPLALVGLEMLDDSPGDDVVAIPLLIGGNDVPRRPLGRATPQSIFVGRDVGVPILALDPVGGGEFPGLVFVALA